jgi:glucan phosphoethanolaminetransferase (alkaline phosphatase superfamily)
MMASDNNILDEFPEKRKSQFFWVPVSTFLFFAMAMLGFVFKMLHWPFADLMFIIGLLALALMACFAYPAYLSEYTNMEMKWPLSIAAGLVLSLNFMGILLHFLTIPGGHWLPVFGYVSLLIWGVIFFRYQRAKGRVNKWFFQLVIIFIGIGIFSHLEGPVKRFERNHAMYGYGVRPNAEYVKSFEEYFYNPTEENKTAYLKMRKEYLKYLDEVMNSK